jgi:hypothetical protein
MIGLATLTRLAFRLTKIAAEEIQNDRRNLLRELFMNGELALRHFSRLDVGERGQRSQPPELSGRILGDPRSGRRDG